MGDFTCQTRYSTWWVKRQEMRQQVNTSVCAHVQYICMCVCVYIHVRSLFGCQCLSVHINVCVSHVLACVYVCPPDLVCEAASPTKKKTTQKKKENGAGVPWWEAPRLSGSMFIKHLQQRSLPTPKLHSDSHQRPVTRSPQHGRPPLKSRF